MSEITQVSVECMRLQTEVNHLTTQLTAATVNIERLRKIVDPSDANHWNVDACLNEVARLVDIDKKRALLLTEYRGDVVDLKSQRDEARDKLTAAKDEIERLRGELTTSEDRRKEAAIIAMIYGPDDEVRRMMRMPRLR